MLSKRNDEHEKILCPSCRGFCRGNDLPVWLRKENGNSAGKIRRQLSAARPAAGGGVQSRQAGRAAGGRHVRRPENLQSHHRQRAVSEEIYRHLFASLLGFDWPSQSVSPGLADWWTNSPDGKTWTFRLRKNLRWSDGNPLTADDVIFTWNDVIYNPDIDNVTRDLFVVGGKQFTVTKVDDLTIQVVTPEIYAPFLENFGAGVPIMPKHILEKTVADKTFTSAYGVNWKPADIVGSGPFRLKDYQPAQSILLERNPYFFEVDNNGQRLPYFDNIIYTVVPDMNAMSLRFLSGESDADDFIFPYEYDHFKAEAAKWKIQTARTGHRAGDRIFLVQRKHECGQKWQALR